MPTTATTKIMSGFCSWSGVINAFVRHLQQKVSQMDLCRGDLCVVTQSVYTDTSVGVRAFVSDTDWWIGVCRGSLWPGEDEGQQKTWIPRTVTVNTWALQRETTTAQEGCVTTPTHFYRETGPFLNAVLASLGIAKFDLLPHSKTWYLLHARLAAGFDPTGD